MDIRKKEQYARSNGRFRRQHFIGFYIATSLLIIGEIMEEISKEVTEMKFMLEKIEGIIDARLVGIEEAEEDEIREIEDYAKRKSEGKIELNEL
jgi:hypothetical protein